MQKVVVDCAGGSEMWLDLDEAEQEAHAASERAALAARAEREQAASDARAKRAAAAATILSAPALCADPALAAALAHVLGFEEEDNLRPELTMG